MANSIQLVLGAAVGITAVIVNFYLLKKAIELMCRKSCFTRGFLIHIIRLIIYGTTAVLSYKLGSYALGTYVACIIAGPVIGALLITGKGEADGKL